MTTWIALFRGINVGGKNVLPMNALLRDLQSLNLENVRTYIQSGNVVFRVQRKVAATLRVCEFFLNSRFYLTDISGF